MKTALLQRPGADLKPMSETRTARRRYLTQPAVCEAGLPRNRPEALGQTPLFPQRPQELDALLLVLGAGRPKQRSQRVASLGTLAALT